MTSQTHSIDLVPGVCWIHLPEPLAHVTEDGVDASVGVVDQKIQSTILLTPDPLKQFLNITKMNQIKDKLYRQMLKTQHHAHASKVSLEYFL